MTETTHMRNNFDVLIRVLDAPTSFGVGGGYTDDDDVSSILTEDERFRLREVITHDVQIKKFLQVVLKTTAWELHSRFSYTLKPCPYPLILIHTHEH